MTNVKKLLTSAQYRPYTAYNIFFQLEREFILQSILHVTPSVDTLFDQAADDVIPMLPQKYQEIVLSDDWYIPGKGQRKKRKHRKSHGKISFSEVSVVSNYYLPMPFPLHHHIPMCIDHFVYPLLLLRKQISPRKWPHLGTRLTAR